MVAEEYKEGSESKRGTSSTGGWVGTVGFVQSRGNSMVVAVGSGPFCRV